jgi:hypothetical protein
MAVLLSLHAASVKSDSTIVSPVSRYLAHLRAQMNKAESAYGVAAVLAGAKAERLSVETTERLEKRIADIEADIERGFAALDEATAALEAARKIRTRAIVMTDVRVASLRQPAPTVSLS